MNNNQKRWSKKEILIAINLYHQLPFGQLHSRNKYIIDVANKLGRTPNALALKLVNLAALDRSLPQKGMVNYSKLDQEVWEEFYNNPEQMIFDSQKAIDHLLNKEDLTKFDTTEKRQQIKARVGQSFFRKTVLSAYDNQCCISKVSSKTFLVASHIKPWSEDEKNRLNPRNGLCLNNLYDKAFDKGLITITPDYKVHISSQLNLNDEFMKKNFCPIAQTKIITPKKFLPDKTLLEYHNDVIFQK